MMKNAIKWTGLFAAFVVMTLVTACEKTNVSTSEEVDNYTEVTMRDLEERHGCGRHGCFELVFPLTVVFPDNTSAEVNDNAELRNAIRTWRTDNPDVEGRPSFAFPIEVLTREGDVILVENAQELVRLRMECRRNFPPNHTPGQVCFRLVYPVELELPSDRVVEVNNPREMQLVLRAWRRLHPLSTERPHLVFPLQVKLQDGTVVDVETAEELQEIKDSCAG